MEDTVDVALGRRAADGCVCHQLAVLVAALGSLDGVASVLKDHRGVGGVEIPTIRPHWLHKFGILTPVERG
jgi:hypothetical protein